MLKQIQRLPADYEPSVSRIDLEFLDDSLVNIGKFSFFMSGGSVLGIYNLEIYPDFRGQGYGNMMVLEMVEMLKKYFWDFQVYLYVFMDNHKAIKTYTNGGFAIVEDPDKSQFLYRMEMKQ